MVQRVGFNLVLQSIVSIVHRKMLLQFTYKINGLVAYIG